MKQIPFAPPDIRQEDIDAVIEVLASGWITTGPKTKLFEKEIAEICQTNRSVALASATAALELTLRILGIGTGDEVIVPAYTYTASAAVVAHVGATLKMVDVKDDVCEFDLAKLEQAITPKTKAIIPVDLGGRLCDYESIIKIVERKADIFTPASKLQQQLGRIAVLADSAHGFGASKLVGDKWCFSGNLADFTVFSFHAVKNLTTAEGGAVTWKPSVSIDDEWLYSQFQLYSLHGQNKDALSKNKLGAWEYDIVFPGFKCNMTDIQSALGRSQLKRLAEITARRYEIVSKYDEVIKKFNCTSLCHTDGTNRSSAHLYLMFLPVGNIDVRNEIISKMAELGVACNVHYKPLPLLTAYKNLGFSIEHYPRAYAHYTREITLPLHLKLSNEDVIYICQCLEKVLSDVCIS